jgi:uncharacterized membrane protein (GlpM family)
MFTFNFRVSSHFALRPLTPALNAVQACTILLGSLTLWDMNYTSSAPYTSIVWCLTKQRDRFISALLPCFRFLCLLTLWSVNKERQREIGRTYQADGLVCFFPGPEQCSLACVYMNRFVDSSQTVRFVWTGVAEFYFPVHGELYSWEKQFRGMQRMGFNLINLNRQNCVRSMTRESVVIDATFYGPREGGTECFHPWTSFSRRGRSIFEKG